MMSATEERGDVGGSFLRHSVPKKPWGVFSVRPPSLVVAVVGIGMVLSLCLASLAIGSRSLPLMAVLNQLAHADHSTAGIIVWKLRLPRTLLAVLAGQALAVSGILMQALTRNPMAEPGLLGINAGAALSVVLCMELWHMTSTRSHVWCALAGAFLGSCFVVMIGTSRAGVGPARLLLAGAALTAFLTACTGIITTTDSTAFASYRSWAVGTVADRGTAAVMIAAPLVGVGLLLALAMAPALNILALGSDQARALGVHPRLVASVGLLAVTILCGTTTAVTGPISFVGLVVPHVLRRMLGGDQRRLVAFALLAGPALVLSSDLVGRVVARPGELECGIVTSFMGAPVLLRMLRSGKP